MMHPLFLIENTLYSTTNRRVNAPFAFERRSKYAPEGKRFRSTGKVPSAAPISSDSRATARPSKSNTVTA